MDLCHTHAVAKGLVVVPCERRPVPCLLEEMPSQGLAGTFSAKVAPRARAPPVLTKSEQTRYSYMMELIRAHSWSIALPDVVLCVLVLVWSKSKSTCSSSAAQVLALLVAHSGSYSAETGHMALFRGLRHGATAGRPGAKHSAPQPSPAQPCPSPALAWPGPSNVRHSTLTRTRIHPHSHTPRETCRPGRPARIIPGLWSPLGLQKWVCRQVPTTYLACPGAACALSLPYPCLYRYPQVACAHARGRRTVHVWSTKAAPNRMPCLQGCAPRAL